jgi:tellurite resistance protein TerC
MMEWIAFVVLVMVLLGVDLLAHRDQKEIGVKEALCWTAFWISLALAFNGWIYYSRGSVKAVEFLTGYVVEQSLSVDNLFVFLTLFSYFKVPKKYQHRVLLWGVIGAQIMRGVMIGAGVALITRFHWLMYVFGAFLIFTGIQMGRKGDDDAEMDVEANPVVRLCRKFLPMTNGYRGQSFLVHEGGRWVATPLMLVVLVVEATDVVFAVDSIPAIFAVTTDPYIVWTSNVFAILGLRSMYFALASFMSSFVYLKYGLSAVLVFVGIKMCASGFLHLPPWASLVVIVVLLGGSVAASWLFPPKKGAGHSAPPPSE